MREQTLNNIPSPPFQVPPKGIPFRERAFLRGNVIGVNAYRVNRTSLKQRLTEGGYQLHETPHFLIGLQAPSPILVIHWFAPQEIDVDLGYHFIEDLNPIVTLPQPKNYSYSFG